ncbi:helix-turn-helix domain-containing protein [Streptomyces sp. NPDC085524]|uniref:helix-turn-helix domain-containing protein n=1 Tax=unclassified Streptomyces TaxID=2593676 RepID=UPI0035DA0406
MSNSRLSIADKLKALMAGRRGRGHTSRSLSDSVDALPGDHPSVSFATIAKVANGSQDNPTVGTLLALCEALGVPPAHLLPHGPYDDLEALEAFEDPLARRVLALLSGLPHSELAGVITDLERRRAHLGLEVPRSAAEAPPSKRRRRRSTDEAARYAADSLEGL